MCFTFYSFIVTSKVVESPLITYVEATINDHYLRASLEVPSIYFPYRFPGNSGHKPRDKPLQSTITQTFTH